MTEDYAIGGYGSHVATTTQMGDTAQTTGGGSDLQSSSPRGLEFYFECAAVFIGVVVIARRGGGNRCQCYRPVRHGRVEAAQKASVGVQPKCARDLHNKKSRTCPSPKNQAPIPFRLRYDTIIRDAILTCARKLT